MPAKGQKSEKTLRLLELINENIPDSEIRNIIGCKQHYISQTRQRYGYKNDKRDKYDWAVIQKYYDDGNSLSECIQKFGMCKASFFKASRRKIFKTRSLSEARSLSEKKGRKANRWSEEAKIKQRKIVAEKVRNGTWHYSFSKVRTHEFDSKFFGKVKLMGSWELEYAKYLDTNNIEWRRPKEKFYYEFTGLKSGKGYYIPDFYLVKESLYVEVKGYETPKDRAKWEWFPKDLNHKVLKRRDLLDLGLTLSDR